MFVIRKDIEQQFREIVGARFEKRIAVEYVFQELDKLPPGFTLPAGRTKPWGTTHAILMAEGVVKEPSPPSMPTIFTAAGFQNFANI